MRRPRRNHGPRGHRLHDRQPPADDRYQGRTPPLSGRESDAPAAAAWASLSAAPDPVGLYRPFVRFGDVVLLSAISSARDGELVMGKVGRDLDLEAGRAAAARAAENLLAVLLEAAGRDPDRIERLLMVRGYVNAAEDFTQVHKVIDGASQLLIARLGEEKGGHARTALGCAALPNGNAVTLEALAQLRAGNVR
ncbi:MAG TPA: RidA family protein [Allosphingosinicella sp.]